MKYNKETRFINYTGQYIKNSDFCKVSTIKFSMKDNIIFFKIPLKNMQTHKHKARVHKDTSTL